MKGIRLLGLVILINSSQIFAPDVHFIGTWYAGFFACFNCVLNHLSWCEKTGKMPIVYWDDRSWYYNPAGFHGKTNAWEYYFEPVAQLNYKPSSPINLQFFPPTEPMEFCVDYMDQSTREKACNLISKYIKVKPRIQAKIDSFYQNKMAGKRTIGIHIRGTDKYTEVPLVSAKRMVEAALQYDDPDVQYFLASDEKRLLSEMITLLNGRAVIYYDCFRASSDSPRPPIGAQSGEDVLVETSLLSKCDVLVHTLSNVSTAALYFNPDLKDVVLV